MYIRSVSVSFDKCCLICADTAVWQGLLKTQVKEFPASSACFMVSHVVLCVLGCTRATLIHSTVLTNSLSDMNNVSLYVSVWKLSYCCADLWLLLWTRQDRERFFVSSATMVIKISRVHSPVVKAADCRSAGPWFNSGWRSCIAFVTWYDKLTNHNILMINIMSPITTSNRTITRKSFTVVVVTFFRQNPRRFP